MSKFQPFSFYASYNSQGYHLLPFRFSELNAHKYLLTNLAGEFYTLEKGKLRVFVRHQLDPEDPDFINLRAKQFLLDVHNDIAPELLALKLRTRYNRLAEFTGLHIFVVSLRCEHSCPYCQVSRQSDDKVAFDMTPEIAEKSLDLVFRSPAQAIKIEFQGGEPLLNFERIQHIVRSAEARNTTANKALAFVIATNLALADRAILAFCKEHHIHISTSLDGPQDLHNNNRPRPGKDSYERVVSGIELARDILGKDQVSALMTTTQESLTRVRDIIDEYLRQDFAGIFLRPLSPYGFAVKTKSFRAYDVNEWLQFYKEGLSYIIEINRNGIPFQEFYASTILTKMLTSQDPGYVDLMNPSGIGIAAIVYNYDGSVYASDESRMLAEMGEDAFKLGNVLTHSYEALLTSDALLHPLEESFTLSVPMCSDCAYEPFCGADPVYHYATTRDYVARKPVSDFCTRNMTIFKYLIELMESDPFVKNLFARWANHA
jgi:uncharacterized protein